MTHRNRFFLAALATVLVAAPAAANQLEPAEAIDIELVDATLTETLMSFAAIIGARLDMKDGVEGEVTIAAKATPWPDLLDEICRTHALSCELLSGEPVLSVRPAGDGHAGFTALDDPGAAKTLAYRFEPPGGPPLEGVAAFTWAAPIHVRAADGPLRLRLSWIPLGPELSVVLPLLERCEPARSSVVLLDPVVLPVTAETRREAEGAVVTLGPAPDGTPASQPPAKTDAACGPERRGEILVTARRPREPGDAPRAERSFKLGDGYLLVTPVDARRPVAAVIALGAGLDGRQGLALLRPTESGAGVEVETLALAVGESAERVVRSQGRPFELTIAYAAPVAAGD